MKGGIRLRLLSYGAGIALPLAVVGLAGIWAMWEANRHQLEDSIKTQAEITAVAFEQWIEAQREPLTTFGAYIDEEPAAGPHFHNLLRLMVKTRPQWVGVHIVQASGAVTVSEPPDAPELPTDVVNRLLIRLNGVDWAIDTNWSQDSTYGTVLLAVPTAAGGVIAQMDVIAVSDSFLKGVKLSEQSVLSIFGPQSRIILYRNPTPETYLGKDMSNAHFYSALGDQASAVVELKSPIDEVWRVYGVGRAGRTGCVALVGLPSSTLYAPAREQLNRYLLFTLMGLLLAVAAAIVIARGIVNPVQWLSRAARRFGAGELSTRATFEATGELEELRASFNSMAAEIEDRETRLKELDRLKSDFVSGVSHEMRTPLTTIKTLARVLKRGRVTESERADFLDTIEAECDRQIDLILNLLDLSRIEAGTFSIVLSPVDVKAVIDSSVTIERHNAEMRHQELVAELPDQLPPVLADRTVLRRVLCGLIENAIKYTPDRGKIRITAEAEADWVKINVTDTGRGILAEDISHIFEKFYRGRTPSLQSSGDSVDIADEVAEAPGVGLGLYLARTIVGEVGGRISVQSVAGRGSTFTVSLPVWDNGESGSNDQESQRCLSGYSS